MTRSIHRNVPDVGRSSIWADISPVDLISIELFAVGVVSLADYRAIIHQTHFWRQNLHSHLI